MGARPSEEFWACGQEPHDTAGWIGGRGGREQRLGLDVAHRHQHDVPAEPEVGLAGVVEEEHHRLVLLGQGGDI
jgi:hypothetical protein